MLTLEWGSAETRQGGQVKDYGKQDSSQAAW
jgi:hypothetical protein